VDKFIGDAIMTVFGSPAQRVDDARRALDRALEIIDVARRWSSERARAGMEPVAIGLGGHFGEVVAGALGSDRLLEYTVIGDTVNVAERLERLSREVNSTLVISAALHDAAGRPDDAREWRRLSDVELRGRRGVIEAFCLDEKARPEPSAMPLKHAR
jgi:adenylate cyclase